MPGTPAGAATPAPTARKGLTAVFWDIENCHLGVSGHEDGDGREKPDDGRVDVNRLMQDLLLRLQRLGLYDFSDRSDWRCVLARGCVGGNVCAREGGRACVAERSGRAWPR
jgi:hypothetical protein